MQTRKFAVGDQVRLLLDSYANDNPADLYTVSRTLPATDNVWHYRVKRFGDGQERAVSESQLAKSGLGSVTDRSIGEAQRDTQRLRNTRAAARTRAAVRRSDHEIR